MSDGGRKRSEGGANVSADLGGGVVLECRLSQITAV